MLLHFLVFLLPSQLKCTAFPWLPVTVFICLKNFMMWNQLAVFISLSQSTGNCSKSRWSRDPSLQPDTWNLIGTSENVFDNPRAVIDSSSTTYQGMLHTLNQVLQAKTQCEKVQGNLSIEVKNEIERRWRGRWGPQGMSSTGGGGPARVPTCVCANTFSIGWHTGGRAN